MEDIQYLKNSLTEEEFQKKLVDLKFIGKKYKRI